MDIDKERLKTLAADCHVKQVEMQNLHGVMQKGGSATIAGQYAVAKVEYQRAKNLLDLEIRNQSVTLIPKSVHASDCAMHNAPAYPAGDCDCGAETTVKHEAKEGSKCPSVLSSRESDTNG